MNHAFKNRIIISIENFSSHEILYLLEQARIMKNFPPPPSLNTSILATCFYEPSTRTRLSFETAMLKLGGRLIGFSDGKNTSAQKGESIEDTIRVIGSFTDVIILRPSSKESIYLAHKSTKTPVINAGNGTEEHPTQTLTDLFTMQEIQKDLQGLSVAFVGDLKYGRTLHSLCLACALFGMRLFFCSPEGLSLPQETLAHLTRKKVQFSFHQNLEEIIPCLEPV
ncbi:Aspartate carbamoyltransferase [Candidatus Rhabdochlamydia oedothoracis]|uniref:Aspartate carbamoyltransferase n=1 Tax=Candidatus Rhabdochlamydia oedothoracis TaxID=2720720 RepID=A0ABX8UZ88_9BACT|nr:MULTISPECIES: aspartate carbamoyltransferase [Rhabdochlamydia]KAG6558658.1 Aspartate carbamoyltransferase [Candidatus Rhabdochlamydia sp. W815]MCL6756281.1 aspartate carbamoyltransferase [Candidatus Rhabdochlamydia oedothoracis]QYF48231.1 Aspartate carbamoyltransferase [Candidatus Rhabdochlamydia oedothoracis]